MPFTLHIEDSDVLVRVHVFLSFLCVLQTRLQLLCGHGDTFFV